MNCSSIPMSARKRRLIVASEARADLCDILRFTVKRWGREQRTVYKAKLDAAMRGLLDYPDRGHPRDHLSPACERCRSRRTSFFTGPTTRR